MQLVDDEVFDARWEPADRREFRGPEFLRWDKIRLASREAWIRNLRRTTSGSITTLQLTVPSKVSTVPGQAALAGLMAPLPIWLREKISVR